MEGKRRNVQIDEHVHENISIWLNESVGESDLDNGTVSLNHAKQMDSGRRE